MKLKFSKRRFFWLLLIVCTLAIPLTTVAAKAVYPDVIPLQNGFQPEGIAVGRGHTLYTGSLNGGAIFRGDLRSGEVEMIAGPGARMAVRMKFDARSGLLLVAGGAFGTAYAFNGDTGELVASYQLTAPFASFINDVIITESAAIFTDSFQKISSTGCRSAQAGTAMAERLMLPFITATHSLISSPALGLNIWMPGSVACSF